MARREPQPSDIIDETYVLRQHLGAGGMAEVFVATHRWTKREVAIKFLNPLFSDDEVFKQRFLAEAQSAAAIEHPNVVDILDMGFSDTFGAYLVMERLRGKSLAAALRRGPFSAERTLLILVSVLDALDVAHAQGVIHRDLKPENILLAEDRNGAVTAKLLDFGIASVRQENPDMRVTREGEVLGTPTAMSPEQLTGAPPSPSFDIWAMGVIFYHCLSGKHPFAAASSVADLHSAILYDEPSPLEKIDAALAQDVMRALEKNAMRRYESMREFHAVMREHLKRVSRRSLPPQVSSSPPPGSSPPPSELLPSDLEVDTEQATRPLLRPISTSHQPLEHEAQQSPAEESARDEDPQGSGANAVSKSLAQLTRKQVADRGFRIAIGTFVTIVLVYVALATFRSPEPKKPREPATSPTIEPSRVFFVDVDTDYGAEEYDSMVYVARSREGELIDRTVRKDRMPYYFEIHDADPRKAVVEMKLLDHAGRELPVKIERDTKVAKNGVILHEVFFRRQDRDR